MPKAKTFAEAKTIVYRLLKIRLRSQKEVRDKLKQREFDQSVIDQTLDYFRGAKLLDDREFARQWIKWRAAKPFGINRIKFELKEKGIATEILDQVLADFKEEFSEEEIVLTLARRRKEISKEKDPVKLNQRLYGYLLRRGFGAQTILKALKKI